MRKSLFLIIFMALSLTAQAGFSDVSPSNTHYVAITYLEEQGVIEGYQDGTFKAYQTVNRAEAVKMLTLASGIFSSDDIATTENTKQPFIDTPVNAWYTKFLIAAKDAEIIQGYEDGSYKPDQSVNLVEALKIYLESYDNIIFPSIGNYIFADTPPGEWFTPYTAYAAQRGMLDINVNNEIRPDQEMSRGYLAEIIYRKLKSGEGLEFGKATYYGKAVQGHNTASGETFDMHQMTAAHKTLPFGTIVRVTNLANGKSVDVKIIDRGPYGPGRVLDLTSGAFEQIAELWQGIINVEYQVISTP